MGCLLCGRQRTVDSHRISKEEFISRASKIHENKYDYSLVEYEFAHDKVKIICPIHGIFEQSGSLHLQGQGCPKCANNQLLTTEEFIERANRVHNYLYDYSVTKYINNGTKLEIICKKHGSFWQTANDHISGGGCPKCKLKSQNILLDKLISAFPNESFT